MLMGRKKERLKQVKPYTLRGGDLRLQVWRHRCARSLMGKGALKRTLGPSFVFRHLTPSLVGIGTHGGCQKCIGMGIARTGSII